MNKFFKNTFGSAILLIATFFASFAQAQPTYFLNHQQSGNEAEVWIPGQKNVLLLGGLLNVFENNSGLSTSGTICQIELNVNVNLLDSNFNLIATRHIPFSSKFFLEIGNARTQYEVQFTRTSTTGSNNPFVGRVVLPSSGILFPANSIIKMQVRGDLSVVAGVDTMLITSDYSRLVPCTPANVQIPEITFYRTRTVVPEKLNLRIDPIVDRVSPRIRQGFDQLATIQISGISAGTAQICPKIYGNGLQPYETRLIREDGLQLSLNSIGCFELTVNALEKQKAWTLITNTATLENTLGVNVVRIDLGNFPEPTYTLTGTGSNITRVVEREDTPKPISLIYE